jgi:hypothetical protein
MARTRQSTALVVTLPPAFACDDEVELQVMECLAQPSLGQRGSLSATTCPLAKLGSVDGDADRVWQFSPDDRGRGSDVWLAWASPLPTAA